MSKKIEKTLDEKTYFNIDGTISEESKHVGFCFNNTHRGYLTKKLMDEHQCLEKNCRYFKKYENSPYWVHRQQVIDKRERLQAEKKYYEMLCDLVLYIMRDVTRDIVGFAVTAAYIENNIMNVRYVSLRNINLREEREALRKLIKMKCNFIGIKTSHDNKFHLLEKFDSKKKDYVAINPHKLLLDINDFVLKNLDKSFVLSTNWGLLIHDKMNSVNEVIQEDDDKTTPSDDFTVDDDYKYEFSGSVENIIGEEEIEEVSEEEIFDENNSNIIEIDFDDDII